SSNSNANYVHLYLRTLPHVQLKLVLFQEYSYWFAKSVSASQVFLKTSDQPQTAIGATLVTTQHWLYIFLISQTPLAIFPVLLLPVLFYILLFFSIAVTIKSEEDEEKPLFSQLHQQQIEDRDVQNSTSADQMKAETGGETSRIPDLNPYDQTSYSSETEVSGDDEEDDDVIQDSELSNSGSSESDVKAVNKSFSCHECGKQFLHKWSLQKHVRVTSHSEMGSPGCLANNKSVTTMQPLESCGKVLKKQKSFSCNDCGKIFSVKSRLNRHMSVHTGEKPFACELCDQRFSRKAHLHDHTRVHTGQKPFACELCEQRFSFKATLNRHLRVHTGQKPFVCKLCGQTFSSKPTLNSHMRVHTGQKPFACENCGQRFSYKANLNTHMRVHTGQKPFACDFCGQRFVHKATLNGHLRVHTGEKPFVCELCGQRFSQRTSLSRHIRVHTGQKPFLLT
uniref:C2H2-type domain-containing protein n=1 Tax=Nothobranchius furzeri TaxID=105023 RepID=A0A8C6MLL1_NOTFU